MPSATKASAGGTVRVRGGQLLSGHHDRGGRVRHHVPRTRPRRARSDWCSPPQPSTIRVEAAVLGPARSAGPVTRRLQQLHSAPSPPAAASPPAVPGAEATPRSKDRTAGGPPLGYDAHTLSRRGTRGRAGRRSRGSPSRISPPHRQGDLLHRPTPMSTRLGARPVRVRSILARTQPASRPFGRSGGPLGSGRGQGAGPRACRAGSAQTKSRRIVRARFRKEGANNRPATTSPGWRPRPRVGAADEDLPQPFHGVVDGMIPTSGCRMDGSVLTGTARPTGGTVEPARSG